MLDAFKRMLVTALGAVGVGALVAGPAWGQDGVTDGNIPAPKLYGGSNDCTMAPKTVVNKRKDADSTILDDALDGFGVIDTATGDAADLVAAVTVGTACADTNPVAAGFDTATRLYNSADTAKRLIDEDDPDADLVADYAEKKADQDAYGGNVYDAVYTQLSRQKTAKKAIADWNDIVRPVEGDAADDGTFSVAKQTRDTINVRPGAGQNANLVGYTPDDPSTADTNEEVIGDYGGEGAIEGFRAIMGFDQAADTAADTDPNPVVNGELNFLNAFTSGGTLRLHTVDHDSDAATDEIAGPSEFINTLGEVSNQLNIWNKAVRVAEGHLEDAIELGSGNLDTLRETVRRAKAGRDHIQSELDRLTAIIRAKNYSYDHDADGGTTPDREVSSVLADYNTELGKRNRAETSVRNAVAALEQARDAVQTQMSSPGSYLEQLVDLRQYQKNEKDAQVADFGASVPASVVKAAEDAAKALENARADLAAHNTLVGDENNPASALISALLETDPDEEDDGQALVNAISSNYQAISNVAQNIQDVESLTGEGGAVTVNAENIATNAGNIATNAENIATNTGNIATNAGNIATNAENIATNAGNIAMNRTDIDANTATLVDHGMKLAQKKQYIDNLGMHIGVDPVTGMGTGEGGMSRIDMNAAGVMENRGMITTNSAGIMENRAMIDSNSMSIMRNMEDIQTLKSGVAASMALAGMPEMGARGVSVGAGSYGGETALAVGVHFSGENSRFKIGVTSSGGETGASLGAGWSF